MKVNCRPASTSSSSSICSVTSSSVLSVKPVPANPEIPPPPTRATEWRLLMDVWRDEDGSGDVRSVVEYTDPGRAGIEGSASEGADLANSGLN